LLKSKLFSGGIENRFLSCLGDESKDIILSLAKTTNDRKFVKYVVESQLMSSSLKYQSIFLYEDEMLHALIHPEINEYIEKFLDLLQHQVAKT
jgi:hypothetical protein